MMMVFTKSNPRLTGFLIHENVLRVFGLIPWYPKKPELTDSQRAVSYGFHIMIVCFLIGTFLSFGLVFAQTVVDYEDPPDNYKDNGLLALLVNIPYMLVNLRAFLVLLFFYLTSGSWHELKEEINSLSIVWVTFPTCLRTKKRNAAITLRNFYSQQKNFSLHFYFGFQIMTITVCSVKSRSKTSKWNQAANALSIFCLLLLIFWEVCEWILFFYQNTSRKSCGYYKALDPLELEITTCQYMPIWTLFCTVPFYLSQLVFIAMIHHALLMRDVIIELLESLSKLRLENGLQQNSTPCNQNNEFSKVKVENVPRKVCSTSTISSQFQLWNPVIVVLIQ